MERAPARDAGCARALCPRPPLLERPTASRVSIVEQCRGPSSALSGGPRHADPLRVSRLSVPLPSCRRRARVHRGEPDIRPGAAPSLPRGLSAPGGRQGREVGRASGVALARRAAACSSVSCTHTHVDSRGRAHTHTLGPGSPSRSSPSENGKRRDRY